MSWMHNSYQLDLQSHKNQTQIDTTYMFKNHEWSVVEAPVWRETTYGIKDLLLYTLGGFETTKK